jgi:nicotinamide phosphoribosyltransferase
MNNLILNTDSYKLTHAAMYPEGTTGVYSYLEARTGARDPYTVFFGLQAILEKYLNRPVRSDDVQVAQTLTDKHIGPGIFNAEGWLRVVNEHGGYLPLHIKAVPEGTVVPVGNVLMTVENTDSQLPWLTNALESLLLHVWYPITVATSSRQVKEMLARKLKEAGHSQEEIDAALPFMLHDFGYRGVSSNESAEMGGMAHLVNFMGTDTLPALIAAQRFYDAEMAGFSVPATEHSIMTSLGALGERRLVSDLLDKYPSGILSLVGDSYDIFNFSSEMGTVHYEAILGRDGKTVLRPDSGDPISQVPALLENLWEAFDGSRTNQSYRVLDSHVGCLWGDGLDGPEEIERIVDAVMSAGFSPINMVFGMGGGLLQKVNRDTERFAFKCSAQKRNGVWLPIQKDPLDQTKKSKAGRLELRKVDPIDGVQYETVEEGAFVHDHVIETNVLETVFKNGEITRHQTFDDIRDRAAL